MLDFENVSFAWKKHPVSRLTADDSSSSRNTIRRREPVRCVIRAEPVLGAGRSLPPLGRANHS